MRAYDFARSSLQSHQPVVLVFLNFLFRNPLILLHLCLEDAPSA